jgi:hypothetical protein
MSPEPANRQQIDALARRAGLKLTDEYLDELVQAYGYVEQMLISPSAGCPACPQVNFAASGGGPSEAGSRRRSSIICVSASATKSLRADSDVSAPSRKSAPVR